AGGQVAIALFVGIAALAAAIARLASLRRPALVPNAIHLPLALFLGISAVSTLSAVSQHAAKLELSRLAIGALVIVLAANRPLIPAASAKAVAALFASTLVLAAFTGPAGQLGTVLRLLTVVATGLVCLLVLSGEAKANPGRWWLWGLAGASAFVVAPNGLYEKYVTAFVLDPPSPGWTIFSTFFNPNPLGGFLVLVIPLAVSLAFGARARWVRLLWALGALLSLGALVPTNSKGAVLAAVISVVCYIVLAARASARPRRSLAVVLLCLALLSLAAGAAVWRSPPLRTGVETALSAESASNRFRILTWQGSARVALAHPWLGIGPGCFKYAFMKYAIAGYTEAAHQNYLQVAAEQGILGGACFLWLLGAMLFTGWRAMSRAEGFRERIVPVGLMSGLVAFLAHSFLDYDWYVGAIMVAVWLTGGALAYQAAGISVSQYVPEAEEAPKGRRRRRRAVLGGAALEPGVRPLPWPRGWAGQGICAVVFVLVLSAMVSAPAHHALAQRELRLGDETWSKGEANAGLAHYRRVTEYDPGWAAAWERYGLAQHLSGYPKEAERAVLRATALEPDNFQPYHSLGRLYGLQGRLREAAEAHRTALARYPNNTRTWRFLGDTYRQLHDVEAAAEAYRRMVEIEHSPYNAYRAIEIDVDVEYAYAHYHLGRWAVQGYLSGDQPRGLETAMAEFQAALRIIRDYWGRAKATDDLYRAVGRPREDRAQQMTALEASVRWRMAAVHELLGDESSAAGERQRARKLAPGVEQTTAGEDAEEQE
ncbi:MAG TPA: O-antigen ligase family protein, partial [Armatimonadota bacterium]|nr:O-antigen ligase family protein [Armatimonadota bacterium]